MGPMILEQILVVLDIIVLYLNHSRAETAFFPLIHPRSSNLPSVLTASLKAHMTSA